MVKAANDEQAKKKAKRFGKAAEQQYKNVYGKKVIWRFKEILDVVELFDQVLKDGGEVYYRFLNKTRLDQLRKILPPFPR